MGKQKEKFVEFLQQLGNKQQNCNNSILSKTKNTKKHPIRKNDSSGQKKKLTQPHTPVENEFDIRKARFEVMKFSMNTLKGSEKEDAEARLAISLGAKPAKRLYLNYKELQQIRKTEKKLKETEEASYIKPDLKARSNKKNQRVSSKGKIRKNHSTPSRSSNKIHRT